MTSCVCCSFGETRRVRGRPKTFLRPNFDPPHHVNLTIVRHNLTNIFCLTHTSRLFADMTSSEYSDVETATTFISSLGGPSLDASDIEWINDLEAGRLLLDWISSQVNMTAKSSGSAEGDDRARRVHAAMKDSTLEAGEVSMFVQKSGGYGR